MGGHFCRVLAALCWLAATLPLAGPGGLLHPPAAGAAPAPSIGVLTEPNDRVRPLVRVMDTARERIFVEAYILSNHSIVNALDRAASEGVDVYVLLERHPFGLGPQPEREALLLRAAGVHVRWAPARFQFTHAKLMVLDDRLAVISTANFSQAGFSGDRDFVLLDRRPADVREASELFRADWDGLRPAIAPDPLVVSPQNARGRIMALLRSARHTLDVYAEELNDAATARLLRLMAHRNVHVRMILPPTAAAVAARSVGPSVRVRALDSPYAHAKAIVVDGDRAFLGSENLSTTSLDRNREVGLILGRAEARLVERVFGHDWQHAHPDEPAE